MKQKVVTLTLNPAIDKTLLLEEFNYGGLNRVNEVRVNIGGKGINVAKLLKGFNVDVLALGLSACEKVDQSDVVTKYLRETNIAHWFLCLDGNVRVNYKIVDAHKGVTTEINEEGFYVTKREIEKLSQKLFEIVTDNDILILNGSVPRGLQKNIYADYIKYFKEKKVKVILDADGDAFKQGVLEIPYAIKPNLYELEQYSNKSFSNENDIILACKGLIKLGINIVVVSMGKDGFIIVDKDEAYKCKNNNIKVVNTVGAGDSIVGALAYCILKNIPMYQMAKTLVNIAAATVSKNVGEFTTIEELEFFDSQIIKLY